MRQVEIRQGNWGHSFSISKAGGGNFYTQGDICFHSINTADKFPSKNLNQVDMNSKLKKYYKGENLSLWQTSVFALSTGAGKFPFKKKT